MAVFTPWTDGIRLFIEECDGSEAIEAPGQTSGSLPKSGVELPLFKCDNAGLVTYLERTRECAKYRRSMRFKRIENHSDAFEYKHPANILKV